jgi:hypothetical protein
MKAIRYVVVALFLGASPFVLPHSASATLTGYCDATGPGSCEVVVTLTSSSLQIALTNTSSASNGGYITADAFDLGAAEITGFATTDSAFKLTTTDTSVSPYGSRDTLVSISNVWLGGGDPTAGLAVTESAKFTLSLTNAGGLTEQGILDSMVIRFKGFADGDSDKDTVRVSMPEMSTLPLLVLGLGGLGVLWRRRRP